MSFDSALRGAPLACCSSSQLPPTIRRTSASEFLKDRLAQRQQRQWGAHQSGLVSLIALVLAVSGLAIALSSTSGRACYGGWALVLAAYAMYTELVRLRPMRAKVAAAEKQLTALESARRVSALRRISRDMPLSINRYGPCCWSAWTSSQCDNVGVVKRARAITSDCLTLAAPENSAIKAAWVSVDCNATRHSIVEADY